MPAKKPLKPPSKKGAQASTPTGAEKGKQAASSTTAAPVAVVAMPPDSVDLSSAAPLGSRTRPCDIHIPVSVMKKNGLLPGRLVKVAGDDDVAYLTVQPAVDVTGLTCCLHPSTIDFLGKGMVTVFRALPAKLRFVESVVLHPLHPILSHSASSLQITAAFRHDFLQRVVHQGLQVEVSIATVVYHLEVQIRLDGEMEQDVDVVCRVDVGTRITVEEVEEADEHDDEVFEEEDQPKWMTDEVLAAQHVLLYGEAGSGKTFALRRLELRRRRDSGMCPVIHISLLELLKADNPAQHFKFKLVQARNATPSIVVIDDIQKVFDRSRFDNLTVSLFSALLGNELKTDGVHVLAAADDPQSLPESLRQLGQLDCHVELLQPSSPY